MAVQVHAPWQVLSGPLDHSAVPPIQQPLPPSSTDSHKAVVSNIFPLRSRGVSGAEDTGHSHIVPNSHIVRTPSVNLGSKILQCQGSDKYVLKGQGSTGHSHIVPNISVTRYKNHSPLIMDEENRLSEK